MADDKKLDDVSVLDKAFREDNPEMRVQASNMINKKITDDTQGHINTQTQWGPLVASILSRDYAGAAKAWNGGATEQVEAYGPDNSRYVKEYNQRGPTGRVFDPNGNELKPENIAELDKQGGLISKKDLTAYQTGGFQEALQGVTTSQAALRGPALKALSDAQVAGVESAGMANLYEERRKLARNSPWMNEISNLEPEKRAQLFEVTSKQINAQQGAQNRTGTSTSATQGTTAGKQQGTDISGKIGVGMEPGGVAPPTGGASGVRPPSGGFLPNLNVGGGVGGSSGSYVGSQTSNTQGTTSGAETSASTGAQEQLNLRSRVEGILNRKMDDKEFQDYQRYMQLTGQIDQANANRQVQKLAPGATPIAPQDPALSGQKNSQIEDLHGVRNESLLSAWTHYLSDKVNAARGKPVDMIKLADEFQNTPVAKGINKKYDMYIGEVKGIKYTPKNGDVIVDNRNRPLVWKDGDWEVMKK
jgi:hypothetical protein